MSNHPLQHGENQSDLECSSNSSSKVGGAAEGHRLLRETAERQKNSGDSDTGREGRWEHGYPQEK